MDKKLYYTQSLNLAAYLKWKGKQPIKSETINGITTFYFEKDEKTFEIVTEYNNDIETKRFITCFRDIKKMIRK